MPSRRSPSQRTPEGRQGRQMAAMSNGTNAGRTISASGRSAPATTAPDEADEAGGGTSGTSTFFARDRFPTSGNLTGTPPSTLTLSRTPLSDSLHLYLNGTAQDEGVDYTIAGKTITILSPMGLRAGDVVDTRYAASPTTTTSGIVVDFGSTGWSYSTTSQASTDYPSDGVEGSTTWAQPTFDDSAWAVAQAPFGWGFSGGVGATPRNTTLTALSEVFMRRTLVGGGNGWEVSVKVDNWGFLYFNGHRIDGTKPSGAIPGADTGTSQLKGPFAIPDAWVRTDFNVIAFHVQDQAGGGGYGGGDVLLADVKVTASL